ncbi:hypothetical protein E2C01_069524 [Portunus trituberculatus]|uniref:Uncharacterized protein n=1 Tax=Portunus trituberculatus TaxID=210409 RepID=A0A5B7HZT2_PORTR|nr:hypothetical protein [Portunus trituberculatus]
MIGSGPDKHGQGSPPRDVPAKTYPQPVPGVDH